MRVEAAGLNHAETLIRSGNYAVRLPFHIRGGRRGSGHRPGDRSQGRSRCLWAPRVCWGAVLGSCATYVTAPASLLVPIPDGLSFEDGACAWRWRGLTAGGLSRDWPLKGRSAVVWGAAGAVGRMLVATLANQGIDIIGIASGKRVDAVRAAGANHVIDRTTEDVRDAVKAYTGGCGVAAVFDPIGAPTYETSLQLLAPRGCLINYGELSGPTPSASTCTCTNSFRGPSSSPSTTVCVGSKDSTSSLVSFRMHWPWPRNAPLYSATSPAASRSTTSQMPTG